MSEVNNKSRQELMRDNSINKKKEVKLKKYVIKNKKYFILFLFVVVILIGIVIFGKYIFDLNKLKKYDKYKEKMDIYGFSELYDNELSTTNEKVTKGEAIKVIIGTILNSYDITNIAQNKNLYLNSIWCEYAEDMKIINFDINEINSKEEIKYKEAISYFYNASVKLKEIYSEELNFKIKDISKYSLDEQKAIKFFVNNNIIKLNNGKINGNQTLYKGMLNELCVNYADKYNVIVIEEDDKININKDKEPINKDDYPFTLANIDKSIYEKPFDIKIKSQKMLPRELYKHKKELMGQMAKYSEEFFYYVLNIDYKSITAEELKQNIDLCLVDEVPLDLVNNYVNYVKENKIQIKGTAKHISPVIYYDGFNFRVRLNLNFKILNSNTNKNLLILDKINNTDKNYLDKEYNIYVDYYMENAMNTETNYISFVDLYDSIIDKNTCNIKEDKVNK